MKRIKQFFARIRYWHRLMKHYRYLKKWRDKAHSPITDDALFIMAKLHVKQFNPGKSYEAGYMKDMM